jgi:excinuclease ABC subunit B
MHLSNRKPGARPFCLLDFFPEDFITVIDESHVTIPQVGAMFKADRSRKSTLVEHGFRLPSALENRPLRFEEFENMLNETVFISATPGNYENEKTPRHIEQIVRPTGLLDPEITIRPLDGQIDDIMEEIRWRSEKNQRIIVTTLTKKSAERLTDYLTDFGLKVKYLHSDIDALQRAKILNDLREGNFDCLIGINLLREGIDLPEVTLVAILDADKEGFLRSERSLIQVAGRAARNVEGRVILYADKMTDSIKKLLRITGIRRKKQSEYNRKNNITPQTIKKQVRETINDIISDSLSYAPKHKKGAVSAAEPAGIYKAGKQKDTSIDELVRELEREMYEAADALEFERAASLRDKIKSLTEKMEI